jgi:hypothetical protein
MKSSVKSVRAPQLKFTVLKNYAEGMNMYLI